MYTLFVTALAFAASIHSSSAQSSDLLGSNGDCSGVSLSDYCCPGSIINPAGDLFNRDDQSVDGIICCVGDPSNSINNGGQSSCTAGSATPLSGAPSTAATVADGPIPSTLSLSSLTLSSLSISSLSLSSLSISDITASGGQTIANAPGATGIGDTSTADSESGSSNGAAHAMQTMAPLLGGAAVAVMGLL